MMRRLVRSEAVKLRTTRTGTALLVGMASTLAILALLTALAPVAEKEPGADRVAQLIDLLRLVSPFVLILGVLHVTNEFRYGTVVGTFLATTGRKQVLLAKLVVGLLAGLVFAAVGMVISLVALVVLAGRAGINLSLGESALGLAGTALSLALYGALGVGIGALLRSQVVALVATLVYFLALEPAVRAILVASDHPGVGRYLVGTAAAAMGGSVGRSTGTGDLLPGWAGFLVLTGYVVTFAVLAAASLQRDVG